MAHFDNWHWADFVRGLCDEPTRSVMQAHLSSGCPSCQKTVETLRAIVVAAQGDVAVAPPEYAVRYAQAVYSHARPETKLERLIARLVYDSAREPLPAGIRAGERLSRRALFAAGDHQVDLQLDRQPTSGYRHAGRPGRRAASSHQSGRCPCLADGAGQPRQENHLQYVRRISPGIRAAPEPAIALSLRRKPGNASKSLWTT